MMYYTKEMYQSSFKEVFSILMEFPLEDLEKIPLGEMQFLYNNMDKSYEFVVDYNKPLQEQKISGITKAILANLYRDYLASYEEKQRIIQKDRKEIDLLEIEKRKKYNPDNIFKKAKQELEEKEELLQESVSMVEYKESRIKKIVNKIKDFFKGKSL